MPSNNDSSTKPHLSKYAAKVLRQNLQAAAEEASQAKTKPPIQPPAKPAEVVAHTPEVACHPEKPLRLLIDDHWLPSYAIASLRNSGMDCEFWNNIRDSKDSPTVGVAAKRGRILITASTSLVDAHKHDLAETKGVIVLPRANNQEFGRAFLHMMTELLAQPGQNWNARIISYDDKGRIYEARVRTPEELGAIKKQPWARQKEIGAYFKPVPEQAGTETRKPIVPSAQPAAIFPRSQYPVRLLIDDRSLSHAAVIALNKSGIDCRFWSEISKKHPQFSRPTIDAAASLGRVLVTSHLRLIDPHKYDLTKTKGMIMLPRADSPEFDSAFTHMMTKLLVAKPQPQNWTSLIVHYTDRGLVFQSRVVTPDDLRKVKESPVALRKVIGPYLETNPNPSQAQTEQQATRPQGAEGLSFPVPRS